MRLSLIRLTAFSSLSIFLLMVLLTLICTWQIRSYSRDWSLLQLHQQGEERLLAYISGIRRDLNRFKPMPFVLSQSDDVRQLLNSRQRPSNTAAGPTAKINRFLEQTNQVSGTHSWSVLDAQGLVVASSDWRNASNDLGSSYANQPFFRQALSGEYGGYFAHADDQIPLYFLSAPIYLNARLIGVAVISVDLRRLQDRWTAIREHLAVSDDRGNIFLASLDSLRHRQMVNGSYSPNAATSALPIRLTSEQLYDDTRITLHQDKTSSGYLVQTVALDDLRWQIHVLSSLAPMRSRMQSVSLFSLGGGLAITLLMLFIRERWLKNLSRQETRELRLKNEAQQRAVINTAQAGLMILDGNGRIRFINPRALQQFGLSQEQILNQPIDRLIAPGQRLDLLQNLARQLSDQAHFQPLNLLEGVALRADNSVFPMMISINPIAWGDEDGYLVTLVDITKRKRAEQELQRANEVLEERVQQRTAALRDAQSELIQQSKLAALGTMSAAIAHELNQPLTAIRTSIFSTRLLLQRQQAEAAEKTLENIVQMTERMALITGQLKTFAHKRPEKLQPVPVQSTLRQVLSMFDERIAQQQIEVTIEANTPLQVLADQPRLEQVLINLIRNALDAMTLSAPHASDAIKPLSNSLPRRLMIAIEQDQQQTLITIGDTGPGLSEQVLEHLFDPFFTTKDVGQGLGLGLSISYGIIRDLDGSIRAENQPGGGALFQIRLPLASQSSPNEKTIPMQTAAPMTTAVALTTTPSTTTDRDNHE